MFANINDKYPKDLMSMIDGMRQQPELRKPDSPRMIRMSKTKTKPPRKEEH